jgi:hypothetical protein
MKQSLETDTSFSYGDVGKVGNVAEKGVDRPRPDEGMVSQDNLEEDHGAEKGVDRPRPDEGISLPAF